MASGTSNYQAWKFRIGRILKEKGLLQAIEENLDKTNSKALAQDNAAFTMLTLNVKDSQITHIQECSTAKQAWGSLCIIHHGIGASGRMVLMQRLWLEFVTGRTGPRKTRAPGPVPRPAPLDGLWRGVFFGIPCPCPRSGPRPTHTPDGSPLKMGGNKRGPVQGMSVGRPRAGAGR